MLFVVTSSESRRSYGGMTSEERSSARRERLVAATIEVLATRGETATTMTAICAEASLTERYFYESFRNRDEALMAALDQVCNEIAAAALAAVEQTDGDPGVRSRAAIRAFVDLVVADPARGRVAVIESTSTPALRARRHELVDWFAELVAQEAATLYGEEAWPRERAKLHGIVFVAGFAELLAGWLGSEIRLDSDQLVDLVGELIETLSRRT